MLDIYINILEKRKEGRTNGLPSFFKNFFNMTYCCHIMCVILVSNKNETR